MFRWLYSILFAASVLLLSNALFAKASSSTGKLIRSLQTSDDFRVRTQAALSLGGSKSADAVEPLCNALDDENTTVRVAAAAAIGRLHLGGDSCLERKRKSEKNATVKTALKKAIDVLRAEPEPDFTSDTRFYVAVGKTTDNTGRSGDEVNGIVRKAMHSAAESANSILMAPSSETSAQAKKRLSAHKGVKGLYLLPRVNAPQYTDKNLKIRIEIAYFTYPSKALLGMLGIPLSAQGVHGKSRDIEDQLIEAASERAIEKVPSFGADVQ
jgi:hypothetical protein